MVHYIALFRVGKSVTEADLEGMIRASHTCFHRVQEAHLFRSGRNLDSTSEFAFFVSAEFQSREKFKMFREDPAFLRFENEVLKRHTTSRVEHLYETDPGKDPKYS
jgi:hypothetical protein